MDKLRPEIDFPTELGYVYDAISLTRHNLQGRVPLFGFCGGPVSGCYKLFLDYFSLASKYTLSMVTLMCQSL